MLKREVSFSIIPHTAGRVWTKKVSFLSLRIFLGIIALGVVGLAVIVYNSFRVHYQLAELHYLKVRNRELETRVQRIFEIERMLARLEKEGIKIKRMLGVEKNPPPLDLTQLVFSYRPILPGSDTLPGSDSSAANRFVLTVAPTVGFRVSRKFTAEHPGIDMAAPLGSPVFATASGIIKETGWDSVYGNYLIIKHGEEYETFYGHLERVNKAKGNTVKANEIVGFVGSTGLSTGPHLHFEVWHKGNRIDPAGLFVIR